MDAPQLEHAAGIEGGAKTWRLLAPDWAAFDTVWRHELPFVLWPIGHQPLLAHWMDEAVRRGVEVVELYVADRPAEVRAWIDNGVYWSRRVKVISIGAEALAPDEAIRLDHLPGLEAPFLPEVPEEFPGYWFELQKQWLAERSLRPMTLDHLHPSGGWVGPHAKIHRSARLRPPFWIGARAEIGPDCEVGPEALIAEGAILDCNVQVEQACVLPRTYLGRNTRLFQCGAAGSVLLDFRRGCRADITEPFIMGPVTPRAEGPGIMARTFALLCWLLLVPLARLTSRWTSELRTLRTRDGETIALPTGGRGPLWLRRIPWLWQVAAGRLRWIGILPRGAEDLAHVPQEIARSLQETVPGVFSLADFHECHDPADPEEWVHAAYQASGTGGDADAMVLRNLWRIAWSQRTGSSQT